MLLATTSVRVIAASWKEKLLNAPQDGKRSAAQNDFSALEIHGKKI
jgi:hypothetical protein